MSNINKTQVIPSSQEIVVLTGATSGLGELTALELAAQGYHLLLVARDKTKAEITRAKIQKIAADAEARILFCRPKRFSGSCTLRRRPLPSIQKSTS